MRLRRIISEMNFEYGRRGVGSGRIARDKRNPSAQRGADGSRSFIFDVNDWVVTPVMNILSVARAHGRFASQHPGSSVHVDSQER